MIKAGRVGVAPKEVDPFGNLIGGGSGGAGYTKEEVDAKLLLKEDATKIGGLEFRSNEGTAQYKIPNGDWTNFSQGSSIPVINATDGSRTLVIAFTNGYDADEIAIAKDSSFDTVVGRINFDPSIPVILTGISNSSYYVKTYKDGVAKTTVSSQATANAGVGTSANIYTNVSNAYIGFVCLQ